MKRFLISAVAVAALALGLTGSAMAHGPWGVNVYSGPVYRSYPTYGAYGYAPYSTYGSYGAYGYAPAPVYAPPVYVPPTYVTPGYGVYAPQPNVGVHGKNFGLRLSL